MGDVLCTICARGGSKGVKNKNIKKINNLELIAYSIIQAKNSNLFNHIVISTDSDDIAEVALRYGGEVFFKRDESLSHDGAAKIPAIRDCLLKSEVYFNQRFETIIDLDASAPLRRSYDIVKAYEIFKSENKGNLITAVKARRNPYFNLIEINENGVNTSKKGNFTTRQSSPKCYDMNASIYIFRRNKLLESENVFGSDTSLYIMDESTAFDIDSELDFEIVEFLIQKANLKPEDF
ncbi:acylneuraminate cytidylyltransferase family protein [Campylobacter sp. 2014D-0216]|uniref:acylneuraminate cytidylyltransferase family protein n=1 Tax=Campylobacter sp. 2014D-0216 TaxID=1813595 RepID=UPI0018A38A95|nr:flagellar modification protein B [Campylobacter sp. 2014D-0216]QOR00880.1 flagellar modification protein B [Campylobacter sp. 2014D-0216]